MRVSLFLSAALATAQVAHCYDGVRNVEARAKRELKNYRRYGLPWPEVTPGNGGNNGGQDDEGDVTETPGTGTGTDPEDTTDPTEEETDPAEGPEDTEEEEEEEEEGDEAEEAEGDEEEAEGDVEEEEEEEEEGEEEEEEEDPNDDEFDSDELLGNLKTLDDSELTETAKEIKELLTGGGDPESEEFYGNVPRLFSKACHEDTCCVWKHMADEMERLMRGRSGRCNKWARFAVRGGFHDSGAWQKDMDFGGADGSLAIFEEERLAAENKGLSDFIMKVRYWYKKYNNWYGYKQVTYADIIQVSASVAVTVCPLGPRMKTYVGRPDGTQVNPTNLLPSPFDTAENLINLFENKTIGPHGLTALIGAHTTSAQQNTSPPEKKGFPQDSTPGVWDILFYKQTLRKRNPPKIFRFPSDERLAVHPKTADEFKEFADPKDGQDHWNEDYAREYVRLSLLGVQDMNKMTDCSKIVPAAIKNFVPRDQAVYDKWLNGPLGPKDREVCNAIIEGDYTPVTEAELPAPVGEEITLQDVKETTPDEMAEKASDFVKTSE